MLKGPVRVVPHWKELQEQLLEKLELQKGPAEAAETLPILLSDRASILFRESSYPSAMPLICSYLADSGAYFASFTWKRSKESKVRVWMFNLEEESSVAEKECSLEEDPRVLLIAHVPCWHLFVAYCEDIHLRFLGDHTQDFKLLSEMISPFSITSMCYSPETGEIVTGAIGMLAFWSFVPGEVPYISVTHKISIENGEFVHFLAVEQERSVLVALCENVIRVYNYLTKAQTQTFQVSQGVSLTCCTVSWIQSTFYTGDLVGDVKVWNFDTGSQMTQFKAHQSAISSIISRSSTHTLMTASLDGMLKEWNLLTCEQLRRVDIGEELFQMQFINDQTFFLRTRYTFSIRTVNNFYQLFNRTKSKLKKLVRIQCRVDKARILARTEDGVIRFLSPVTGEMLFVTWPFQALEKALDYVYDPDREELLVTTGTADIYVLDTTRNPCPIKYILRAADTEDKVLCLAYTCLDLAGRTLSFIFSGYKSGKVRTLTQHLYRMRSRKLHDGNVVALTSISASGHQSYRSRESSYLCSYGLDEYIILSDVFLKKNGLLEVLPLVIIPSTHCRINHLLLIPGYICVLTDQNRVRLWRQAALVPGQKNPFWQETDVMHSTTITSFDYCHALNMLVTGGSDGSVRLWDILGQLLVEFDTSLRFSQVCFANQWGDLVVGCNMDIYFISCVTYLPNKYLSALAGRRMREDVVERPLPFLPNFLLTFDIVFVPKYRQVGKQAMKYERLEPISNHKEVVLEKNIAKVVEFVGKEVSALPGLDARGLAPLTKDARPEFAVEYQDLPQEKMHVPAEPPLAPPPYRGLPALEHDLPLLQRIHFQAGRLWPIAPDGYVPNSVIRAQLFPKGTPKALQCSLLSLRQPLPKRKMVRIQLPEWDETEVIEKAWKKKATRSRHAPPSVEGQRRRDLLAEIVSKPWLRHKPSEISLSSVLNTILNLMDDVPYSTYLLCTTTLVQLSESYALPPELKRAAFMRLMQDTKHKEVSEDLGEELGKSVQFAALQRASPEASAGGPPPSSGLATRAQRSHGGRLPLPVKVRMRLATWEALGKMDLLGDQEVLPLAQALLDENKKVRDLARSLLDSVAGITDKYVLKKEMQRLAETSLADLSEAAQPGVLRQRSLGIRFHEASESMQALMEEARRLVNRVENQLTDNLFLLNEPSPMELRRSSRPRTTRKRLLSGVPAEDFAKSDDRYGAEARWLGLFGRSEKRAAQGLTAAGMRSLRGERQPRIHQARGRALFLARASRAALGEKSPGSSSSSGSTSSGLSDISESSSLSTLPEEHYTRKMMRRRQRRHRPKALVPTAPTAPTAQPIIQERPMLPPILTQRRDTRSQVYTEIVKHHKDKKEHVPATVGMPGTPGPPGTPTTHATQATQATHATQDMPTAHTTHAMPAKPKQDGSPLQAKVGELEHLQLPPPEPPSSLIDPKQRYSPDKSKWRSDLYKLMMLRIAPAVEGRTVTQDLLASAKCALSGRSMSWEAFASAAFPLVSSPEEITAETAKWQKYVEDLLRSPSWLSASEESLESVLAVKGRDSESDLERGDASQEKAGRGQGEAAEETEAPTEKKAEGKASKEPRTALRKKARKMTDREGKAAERLAKAGAEKEAETSREKVRGLLPKDREQEVSREKLPAFLPKAKEQEGVKGKESSETAARAARQREAAKGREAELAKGREREPEAAPPRREPPRGFQAREHGPARARELDAVQRKDREAARRRAEEPKEKRAEEEGKEPARGSDGEARARAKATKALLTDSDQQVPTATESVLAEMRAEAKERMLAELKDRAMAEAQRIALSEVKEKALAEARLLALSEARERALIKARKRAIAEQWEKILAEARKSAQQEVMELALAKAREAAYAEGGQVSEERIWELARAQAAEMAEARAKEIALAAAIEVDEQRVLELAEAEGLDLDEARVLELAEARAQALAEERTQALAEERFLELAEERKKQLLVDEEGQGTGESQDLLYEEEGMWEDLREESFSFLSEEEKEALLFAMWQEEEQAAEEELDLSAQAQLLLDILTKPEKLQASDSTNFQRLFQAATLLQAPPTADAEGLAETLLKKAEEILEEGKEQAGSASVWQELREALEARQPWHTDPSEFAGKMRDLQKTALTMLRARNLKQQLQREAMKKAWWEKAEKEWVEDEGRIKGKRDWLGKRFREAFGKWQAQQEKSERERLELKRHQKRLQFRARPIVLAISRRDRDRERKKESEQEQAAAAAAAAAAEELAAEEETAARLARQRQRKLTWSLAVRRDRAWKSIVQLEEEEQPQAQPQASERLPQLSRPKSYRLPKDSLYKTTKAAVRVHRKKLRRKGRQHIFHLDEDREVDWEKFTKLYQSLLSLKMVEGGVGSLAWQEKSSRLLDIYGMSNPLIRAMIRQALMGDHRQRKYVRGVPLRLRKAQANLGERILSEIIHHGTCQQHGPPALHGVIPLSYQNNVQTFQIQGVARFGALSLSWKAFCTRGKLPRLQFCVRSKSRCR